MTLDMSTCFVSHPPGPILSNPRHRDADAKSVRTQGAHEMELRPRARLMRERILNFEYAILLSIPPNKV